MNLVCVRQNCRPRGRRAECGAAPGLRLCAECAEFIRIELAELPGLYDDCEHALVGGPHGITLRVGRGRRATGISLREDAFKARSRILACLASWAALVADERTVPRPVRFHPVDLVAFLRTHLDWLLTHSAAADFAAEITDLTAYARRSRQHQEGRRRELGECVHPGCTAILSVTPANRDSKAAKEIRCAAGHVWQPHQWLQLSRQIQRARHRATTTD
jgi:hypothetical protein